MTGGPFGDRFGDTELADAFDGSDRGPVQHGTGLYLTDMADVLRRAGLTVTEQEGWRTRARSSGGYKDGKPWCIMWHHAASSPGSSAENVANYASYGSDVAPVCNLVLGRDGAVIVCAAGATNTNGTGGPHAVSKGTIPADSMNTAAIGIEAVNTGVGEPWPVEQIDAYFTMTLALCAAYGLEPDDACTHAQWAPGRKIDPAVAAAVQGPWRPGSLNSSGTWSLMDIKAELRARATAPHPPTPTPPPNGDDEMLYYIVTGASAKFIGSSALVRWTGPGSAKVDAALQTQIDAGNLVPFDLTGGPNAFAATFLDGPLPTGDGQHQWTGDEFANAEQIKAGQS